MLDYKFAPPPLLHLFPYKFARRVVLYRFSVKSTSSSILQHLPPYSSKLCIKDVICETY